MSCEYLDWNLHQIEINSKTYAITVIARSDERGCKIVNCEAQPESCPVQKVLNFIAKKPMPEVGLSGDNISYPTCPIVAVNARRIP